jgi:hypothetical protein
MIDLDLIVIVIGYVDSGDNLVLVRAGRVFSDHLDWGKLVGGTWMNMPKVGKVE